MNKPLFSCILVALVLTSCCRSTPCNSITHNGIVSIIETNAKITEFKNSDSISFLNSNGARFVFEYSLSDTSLVERPVDCTFGGCDDVCCDFINTEVRSFELVGTNNSLLFSFTLSKFEVSSTTPITSTGDAIKVKLANAQLEIPMVDGAIEIDTNHVQYDDSLSLLGHLFYDVYSNKQYQTHDSTSAHIKSIYFNRKYGVVGWSLNNGEIWSLE